MSGKGSTKLGGRWGGLRLKFLARGAGEPPPLFQEDQKVTSLVAAVEIVGGPERAHWGWAVGLWPGALGPKLSGPSAGGWLGGLRSLAVWAHKPTVRPQRVTRLTLRPELGRNQ